MNKYMPYAAAAVAGLVLGYGICVSVQKAEAQAAGECTFSAAEADAKLWFFSGDCDISLEPAATDTTPILHKICVSDTLVLSKFDVPIEVNAGVGKDFSVDVRPFSPMQSKSYNAGISTVSNAPALAYATGIGIERGQSF